MTQKYDKIFNQADVLSHLNSVHNEIFKLVQMAERKCGSNLEGLQPFKRSMLASEVLRMSDSEFAKLKSKAKMYTMLIIRSRLANQVFSMTKEISSKSR